jgi:ectoine hydroxylase-related dioxygenase (phytanoyl-CoA dioxygenase family)
VENGATRVVPGSHLSGANPDPDQPQETVSVTGKAGSALVFEGRTWHAADFNRSNAPRYGITTYYCGPQFRQMMNFPYGTAPEVVEGLSPDMIGLLGFRPWRGYGSTGDPSADRIAPADKQVGRLSLK